MKKKAIVAGHICIDITPVFPNDAARHLTEILVPGKLIHMDKADVHTGGAVANTGLAMKKFGVDVTLMGKVGNDDFGSMIQNILRKHGADHGLIRSEEGSTSYSIVLAMPGIDRIFLHNPGANDTFSYDDIPKAILKENILFHFGYPPIMKSMYQDGGKALVTMFREVKRAGLVTSLDMAAVDPKSEAGKADWEKILTDVLPFVDFFMPSLEELVFMLDKTKLAEWEARNLGGNKAASPDIQKDIKPLADQCMAMGAKVVLVKCGASGLYFQTGESDKISGLCDKIGLSAKAWATRSGFEKSYVPEQVLSATGAGDTCIAAFLASVLEGRDLQDCLHLAAAAGAVSVSTYDALSGLMPLEELEAKIKGGWKKQG